MKLAGYYGFMLVIHVSVCLSDLPLSEFSFLDDVFSFLDDNLSKCQWIFTKLCMGIDIVKIWFRIANGQISNQFLIELSAGQYINFWIITSKYQCIMVH